MLLFLKLHTPEIYMEDFELEQDPLSKMDIIEETLEEIADALLLNEITDDNPSRRNGLTSLEQILLYELGEYMDNKRVTLRYLKEKTHIMATELEILDAEHFGNKDDEEDVPLAERVDFNSECTRQDIENIAHAFFLDIITDDNISPTTDETSLQQLIQFVLRDYSTEEEDLDKFYNLVCGRTNDFFGGAFLQRDVDRHPFLRKDFVEIKF